MATPMHSGATLNLAAVDLGAESGRVVLARYDGSAMSLQEVARFPNRPVRIDVHLYWDIQALWEGVVQGLRRARTEAGTLHSVGVDSWAVDYALVDEQARPLEPPYHYRDTRTQGMIELVCARLPREAIYAQTGIQFLPINTLYQLAAHRLVSPALLDAASRMLMVPDLLHAWLSGEQVCERTNATTTQMWAAREARWADAIVAAADIPAHLLPPVVAPGTHLGTLVPALAQELGADVQVAAPGTHDTASAVAAVPATSDGCWAYISSGTWCLVGLELPEPLISAEGLAANFTNEGGVFGTTRFLKNVMGLWLVQECRRAWARDGTSLSYGQLFAMAEQAEPFSALIDPDDERFLAPEDMPARIREHVAERGLGRPPEEPSAVARCVLESLVLRYRAVLESAATLANRTIDVIHVVGGGARSALLNQWLADATGLPVVAGPVEASALGNALLQLAARRELASLADMRHFLARTTQTTIFAPGRDQRAPWDDAYGRLHPGAPAAQAGPTASADLR